MSEQQPLTSWRKKMPLNDRGTLKSDCKKAIAALDKSAMYLLRMRAMYAGVHQEYADALDQYLLVIDEFKSHLIEFAKII